MCTAPLVLLGKKDPVTNGSIINVYCLDRSVKCSPFPIILSLCILFLILDSKIGNFSQHISNNY